MKPLTMRKTISALMFVSLFGLFGCKLMVTPVARLIPQAPAPAATPAEIANLLITPSQVQAGASIPVTLTFDYEDLNADVNSNTAQIEIQLRAISGSLGVSGATDRLSGLIVQDDAHWGRRGRVSATRVVDLPDSEGGTLGVQVTLIDAAGQRSNTLTGQVSVLPAQQSGGGVGPGGDRCTIIDGDRNPVTLVRIGRQVFFRISDPDNNFSSDRQDRLFRVAALQAGSSGDIEIINWMLETGVNTGVFEGPAGGVLLTSRRPVINNGELSVLDNDTIMGIYEDPNSPGDVCIAIAKVL